LYGSCGGIRYPLLLGHGGFPQRPMSRTSKAGLPIQFEWTKQSPSGDLAFGFAVFDFDRDSINVQLVAQDGPVEHSFRIS